MRFKLLVVLMLFSGGVFAQSVTMYMSYGGVQRDFTVHLPTGYSNGQHLPVVFNFHGFTSNAYQQELYSQMSTTADANHFIVVYPDGVSNQWNVGWFGTYNTGVDDVGFVSKMIDTLSLLYHIDLNRVYATGISNGGFLSHRLACELSDRIAAIASVAGELTDSTEFYCHPSHKMPVMLIHGTADPTVPYAGLPGSFSIEQTISYWLNKNSCSTVSDTVNVPNTNTTDSSTAQKIDYAACPSSEVLFYKIIGGGHTWPNGIINTGFGPTCRDFDGSTEIWNFFNRYTLSSTTAIHDISKDEAEINVYPNPVEDKLTIDMNTEIKTIEVFNLLGEQVLTREIYTAKAQLNIATLANGIYVLRINTPGFSLTRRIVKN